MTVRFSPHKVRKILRGYFRGLPQIKIAKEAGVDQSSISHYANKFTKMTAKYGLLAAGKEYQVMNEIESLSSLSVELFSSKLTVEEARQGYNIIKEFLKLGINPEQHLTMIKVCQEVNDSGFVKAARKLSHLESQTGMGYQQVISDFEKALNQLPQLEEKVIDAKAKLKAIGDVTLKNKQELAGQEEHLKKYQDEVKVKEVQLEKELSSKMKQLEVEKKEVEELAALKAELTKKGLNLKTVLSLVKEF
ncbi:MAG: hypothetical protein ABR886_12150 [Dehalococcoidales bacterium]|jgi:DNA polymerase III delta prime subunit